MRRHGDMERCREAVLHVTLGASVRWRLIGWIGAVEQRKVAAGTVAVIPVLAGTGAVFLVLVCSQDRSDGPSSRHHQSHNQKPDDQSLCHVHPPALPSLFSPVLRLMLVSSTPTTIRPAPSPSPQRELPKAAGLVIRKGSRR